MPRCWLVHLFELFVGHNPTRGEFWWCWWCWWCGDGACSVTPPRRSTLDVVHCSTLHSDCVASSRMRSSTNLRTEVDSRIKYSFLLLYTALSKRVRALLFLYCSADHQLQWRASPIPTVTFISIKYFPYFSKASSITQIDRQKDLSRSTVSIGSSRISIDRRLSISITSWRVF